MIGRVFAARPLGGVRDIESRVLGLEANLFKNEGHTGGMKRVHTSSDLCQVIVVRVSPMLVLQQDKWLRKDVTQPVGLNESNPEGQKPVCTVSHSALLVRKKKTFVTKQPAVLVHTFIDIQLIMSLIN